MKLLSLIKWDMKAQARYGLYFVYLGVTAVYALILLNIPLHIRGEAGAVTILSDPSILGFYMIGGLVLFERDSRFLSALFTTPLPFRTYITSKIASLTAVSLIAALILSVPAGLSISGLPWIVTGVILTSVLFVMIGFTAVSLTSTLNWYLISSGAYMAVFAAPPLLFYFGVLDHFLWNILPTRASLILIRGGFFPVPAAEGAASIVSLLLWIAGWYPVMRLCWLRRLRG
jgi:fluoroquinolone transport system permease protein